MLNGIAGEPEGLRRVSLAVLPIGTVNVFARELRIPLKVRAAWELIQAGSEQAIDLPWIEFHTREGPRRRCFAQLAGAGFDARAIELVSWELKQRIGSLAYAVASLKAWRRMSPALSVNRGRERLAGDFVIIGNGRFYAGSIPICPRASNADGLLDVCLFPRTTLRSIARHVCACLVPSLARWSPAVQFQTSRVEIAGEAGIPLELDGELAGGIPACCSIAPQALRVIGPA